MNVILLSGRCVKDVVKKVTTTQKSVVDFSIAVNKKDGANFINVQAWNQTADYLDKYAKKGAMLVVEGSLEVQTYDKNGVTQYKTFVLANRVELVGKQEVAQETHNEPSSETETQDPFASQTKVEDDPFAPKGKSLVTEDSLPF